MFVVTKFCHDKHTFVMTKDVFCHKEKAWCDKTFVATKLMFVTTKPLSQQKYVCRNKSFVVTRILLLRHVLS